MIQHLGAIDHIGRHEMHDAFRTFLHAPLHQHQPRGHDRAAQRLELPCPEHAIGDARFILQGDEDGIALARSLAHEHQPCHAREATIGPVRCFRCGAHAFAPEMRTQHRHGMRFQREAERLVIGRDMFAEAHFRQVGFGFLAQFRCFGIREKRERIILRQAPHFPKRAAPVEPE